jgi:hypothetical protein
MATTILVALTIFTGMMDRANDLTSYEEICTIVPEDTFLQCDNKNPFDGYWWLEKIWVPGYLSVESWYTPAPDIFKGNAVFYADGVAKATARVRGLDLKGYVDGVSLMSPADIGLPVWLKRPGYQWEGPFLVIDSATRGDIYPVTVYRQEAVEVGFTTALKWGMVNEQGDVIKWRIEDVEVSKLPPGYINGISVYLDDWWLNTAYEPATTRELYTPIYRAPSTWRIDNVWVTFSSPVHDLCISNGC